MKWVVRDKGSWNFSKVSLASSLTPEAPDIGSKQKHREAFGKRIKDLPASSAARNRSR